MQFKRSDRVAELLRHEISALVQEIGNPNLGFVTITGVKVSGDLSEAKVFFSVYGTEEEIKRSTEILNNEIPSMRRILGRRLESLKKVPTISFLFDTTPQTAQRVTEILRDLAKENSEE